MPREQGNFSGLSALALIASLSPVVPDSFAIDISRPFREEVGVTMPKQWFRERECIHKNSGAEGESYSGVYYLQALQRLPIDNAMLMASKVESFFWADAPHIVVWLCQECATELGIADMPRAISQSARKQA